MKLRLRNHLFFFYHYKTFKVYGLSSKVPNSTDLHYLLYDIDSKDHMKIGETIGWFTKKYSKRYTFRFYVTHNGLHVVIFKAQPFIDTVKEMLKCPYIDKSWVALGIRRGYFFLQTYVTFKHSRYPITYMKVDRIA